MSTATARAFTGLACGDGAAEKATGRVQVSSGDTREREEAGVPAPDLGAAVVLGERDVRVGLLGNVREDRFIEDRFILT